MEIKMVAVAGDGLQSGSMRARLAASLLLFAACAALAPAEELRDLWHYDLGVAKIGKQQAGATGSNSTSDLRDARNRSKQTGATPDAGQTPTQTPPPPPPTTSTANASVCDFRGRRLRVAVAPQPPFVSCLQDLYGDWLCNGSNIELVRVLEQRFNFRADWVVLTNNHMEDDLVPVRTSGARPGPQLASGLPQSSGIFGLVSTGRVLLSANGVMKTMDRSGRNLIVSEPFDSFRLHFLLSKSVHDHDHIFIKPFSSNAWLAILSSAALVVPVFYFINSTTAYYASVLDDKQLARVGLVQCWRQWRKWASAYLALGGARSRLRSNSLVSTSALLEGELNRIVELRALTSAGFASPSGALHRPTGPFATSFSGATSTLESSLLLASGCLRRAQLPAGRALYGESARRRRLERRQWAYERRRARKASKLKRAKSGFSSVAYVIWYVVASLANQGGETEDLPRADSTRVLVAFWWLYMIVVCAIHSGILTALLTFPKQNDFIQTLDDYLNLEPSERAHLHLAVDKYSELAHLLIDSDNLHKSPLQELQKQRVPISYVNFQRHRQRILDEVQLGQSAFVEENSLITQIISHEYYDSKQTKCLFKASRYPIDVIPMALLLSDRMPPNCVSSINALLRRVMITGLAQKWRRKYEAPGNDCLNTVVINAGDVDKIELKHVVLAFWLLALGACLGLLALALEIVWLFTRDEDDDDDDDDEEQEQEQDDEDGARNHGGKKMRQLKETGINIGRGGGGGSDSSLTSGFLSSSSASSSSSLSTSLVASTTSDESDRVKLGFKRALMPSASQLGSIRSLKSRRQLPFRTILRKTKRNRKRISASAPKITFALGNESDERPEGAEAPRSRVLLVVDEREGLREVRELYTRRNREKRDKRTTRGAERRARRVKKTMDLVRRIHDGKMYSERVKSRLRRMSHSIANHLHPPRAMEPQVVRAPRLGGGLKLAPVGRVVPM